jgi:hypothetical protein
MLPEHEVVAWHQMFVLLIQLQRTAHLAGRQRGSPEELPSVLPVPTRPPRRVPEVAAEPLVAAELVLAVLTVASLEAVGPCATGKLPPPGVVGVAGVPGVPP